MQKNQNSILTIAIPTYQRSSTILNSVELLIPLCKKMNVQIVIIDNGSTDNTYITLLKKEKAFPNIKIVKYKENMGFKESFVRIFDNVHTKYVMVMSDEDLLIESGLQKLINKLEKDDVHFISPLAMRDDKLYRGINKSRKIKAQEFGSSSFYISGLVFNLATTKHVLRDIINKYNDELIFNIYPQSVLVSCLILEKKCFWSDVPIVNLGEILESHIAQEREEPYFSLKSRIQQHVSWFRIFNQLQIEHGKTQSKKIKKMKIQSDQDLFRSLLYATEEISLFSRQSLEGAAKRWSVAEFIKTPIRIGWLWIKRILRISY